MERLASGFRDSGSPRATSISQGFQACTPRVVPLGFGLLVGNSRRLPLAHIRATLRLYWGKPWSKPFRGTTLRGTTQKPLNSPGPKIGQTP